jgi:hypothetical protein
VDDGKNRAACRAFGYEFQYDAFEYFTSRREEWNLRLVVTVRNPLSHVLSMLTHELYHEHRYRPKSLQLGVSLHSKLHSRSSTFNRVNMMTSVLSGADQNATVPVINLTHALNVLDSAYLVLVTEYLDSGIALLMYLLGEAGPPACANLTAVRRRDGDSNVFKWDQPESVNLLIDDIEDRTRHDMLLYGAGVARFFAAFRAHCV